MVTPLELVVTLAGYLILSIGIGLVLRESWHESGIRVRESLLDLLADGLTRLRTFSFRRCVLALGQAIVAVGCRVMQWAQRPDRETADLIRTRLLIGRQWERRDVVISREHDVLRVKAAGRVLTFKV